MDQTWVVALIGIISGLVSGSVGVYVGMRVGLVTLETHMEYARVKLDSHTKSIARVEEDVLIHDVEMEDVMAKMNLKRKRRQNWRFSS